ncbi:MAG: Mut7-C RNAse domain-containing protein [Dehalococcoidales bacterium]|nr:Mut7-C RNAse domain-containing protein [Dehalococcoidales bacterium]
MVDHNVGRLLRWLRMMGYDSVFFSGDDDGHMVKRALAEGRIILTRDRAIMLRRVVRNGRVRAVLIENPEPEKQMLQLAATIDLKSHFRPFTLCLECNRPLVARSREEVDGRVPPYVFQTQNSYTECPSCHRIYWRGTHWEAMVRKLEKFLGIHHER